MHGRAAYFALGCAGLVALLIGLIATSAASAFTARTVVRPHALRPRLEDGTPIALDAPDNGSAPLIAYAPDDGYTYVAWNAPNEGGIDLCVVPANATACEGGGPVALTDDEYGLTTGTASAPVIAGLTVLSGGEVVVLGSTAESGVGTLAWASPEGGAEFLTAGGGQQYSGRPISPVSLFYTTGDTAPLGADDVALLDSYFGYFSDSPYAGPETPSSLTSPNANATGGVESNTFTRKSLWAEGTEIETEAAPAPAAAGTELVVAVGDNFADSTYTPSGCLNYAATGYAVSAGKIGGLTSGYLNHTGIPSYSTLACSAEAPVLAGGGTDGIGVLEEEGNGIDGAGSTWTVDWRPFIVDSTGIGGVFGSPVELEDITNTSLDGGEDFDAVDDSGTGVYASWEDEQGLVLDYSADGGASWAGPRIVPGLSNGVTQGDPVIAGVAGGLGEVAYDANPGTGNQVFLQAVDFAPPLPTTVTTSQTSGTTSGSKISIAAGTVGETDKATLGGTNAALANGTMTYSLYDNNKCTGATVSTSSAAVTGGVSGASAPITAALQPGTYYWQASYGGDTYNDAASSSCGSEVLTVTAPATTGGSATTNGTTVTLTISCSGPCTVTVTIEIASGASLDGHHKREIVLATGKLKERKRGKGKLKLHWNRYARSLLKHDHDKLTTTLVLKTKISKGTFTSDSSLRIRR